MHPIIDILLALIASIYYTLEAIVVALIPAQYRSKDISNDIVLITGGGSGIGRLMAIEFAKKGATIVTWDVNKEGNDETAQLVKKEGGTAYAYRCDLSSREDIYATAQKVKEEVGKVTILVNNAGIVTGRPLLDSPDNMIVKTFEVNTLAHFWTVKAFLPDMIIGDRGHIVTIASLAGLSGVNQLVDYCSSKFAAVGFDESLRIELHFDGRKGINTTVICPFYINTGMFDGCKSRTMPILEPQYVADRVVTAVLTNEKVVVIPSYAQYLVLLKFILPQKALAKLFHATGSSVSMAEFKGRSKRD